ncbi:hypothetical protein EV360DRAFT_42527, partial [Lentinula raphanica]
MVVDLGGGGGGDISSTTVNLNTSLTGAPNLTNDKDLLDSETLVTIVIPNGFIPLEKPKPGSRNKYRIWGGGVPARLGSNDHENISYGRDRERERQYDQIRGRYQEQDFTFVNPSGKLDDPLTRKRSLRRRRIYTDDSDIFLCAIHSGWISWSGARKAREEGKDLRVCLRIIRCLS